MTWSAIGVLAELVAALAVVASLLYVSRQIKQTTHAVRTANATTVQGNFQGLARTLYSNLDTAAVVLKGMSDPAALSPHERLAAYAWFFDMMKTAELAHYNYRHGDLDPALWEASLQFYRAYFNTPGMREYWQARQFAFVPEFRTAMEGWLAEQPELARPDTLVKR